MGRTFLATALGHAGIRRRYSVHFEKCDRMPRRLRSSRLDKATTPRCKSYRVDLLIIDDFALRLSTPPTLPTSMSSSRSDTAWRRRVVTSNREPIEWLGLMADPMLGPVR